MLRPAWLPRLVPNPVEPPRCPGAGEAVARGKLEAVGVHRLRPESSPPLAALALTRRERVMLGTLVTLLLATLATAQVPQPERAEGWVKRSLAYVQREGELAESRQQWQGSVVGRFGLGPRFDLVLRADTRPQSSQFTDLASVELWQSLEVMGGPTWTALQRSNVELVLAGIGGVALQLDGTDVGERPAFGFGGLGVRFGQAYVYLGLGVHQAVNGNRLAVLGTLHVPLGLRQLAIDVDLVTGRARRIIVSLAGQVFGWKR